MGEHERGEVTAKRYQILLDSEWVDRVSEDVPALVLFRHVEPLVRQSDYLEAVAEIERLRADNEALRIAYEGAAIDRDGLRARIEGE